jgi:hypothetical protein
VRYPELAGISIHILVLHKVALCNSIAPQNVLGTQLIDDSLTSDTIELGGSYT